MAVLSRLTLLVHRYVWQSIPRRWRRAGLVNVTAILAPRSTATKPAQQIIVVGFLTAASGLGASARLCHEALRAAGLNVLGIDLTQQFRQGAATVPFAFVDGRAYSDPATLILHINGPFVPLAMFWLGRTFVRNKFVVAYWAWELPDAPAEWRAGLGFVHHIFVPSVFAKGAIQGLQAPQPIDVLAHPVALNALPASPGAQPSGVFKVLIIFNMASGFERKNPMASIAAFAAAFGDDPSARLVVKVQNPEAFPEGARQLRDAAGRHANIALIERSLSGAEMAQLYHDCEIVLSLHRSEGFGLVIAEAMLAGKPVIATNWSGNVDFMTEASGIPIDYRLVPARDPQGEYDQPSMHWAEADISAAAAALRRLRDSPELREALGHAALTEARSRFSGSVYVQRLKACLSI